MQTHLVGAVHDHGTPARLHRGEQAAGPPSQVGELAEIATPASHCDYGTGRIDARSGDDAPVYRPLQAERRPAHVANGGDPAAAFAKVARDASGRATCMNSVGATGATSGPVPLGEPWPRQQRFPQFRAFITWRSHHHQRASAHGWLCFDRFPLSMRLKLVKRAGGDHT